MKCMYCPVLTKLSMFQNSGQQWVFNLSCITWPLQRNIKVSSCAIAHVNSARQTFELRLFTGPFTVLQKVVIKAGLNVATLMKKQFSKQVVTTTSILRIHVNVYHKFSSCNMCSGVILQDRECNCTTSWIKLCKVLYQNHFTSDSKLVQPKCETGSAQGWGTHILEHSVHLSVLCDDLYMTTNLMNHTRLKTDYT